MPKSTCLSLECAKLLAAIATSLGTGCRNSIKLKCLSSMLTNCTDLVNVSVKELSMTIRYEILHLLVRLCSNTKQKKKCIFC